MNDEYLRDVQIIDPESFDRKITGYVGGEAYFRLQRLHMFPTAAFVIKMRADEIVLHKIRKFWGCGKIYYKEAHIRKDGRLVNPMITYYVSRPSDLMNIIVPHFERWVLECKKGRDFIIWRQGVELIYRMSRRKRRSRKSRWYSFELAQFEALRLALIEQRRYESSGLIIAPPPTNGHVDPQGLLFDIH